MIPRLKSIEWAPLRHELRQRGLLQEKGLFVVASNPLDARADRSGIARLDASTSARRQQGNTPTETIPSCSLVMTR